MGNAPLGPLVSVPNIVSKESRVVLLSRAGAGKSTAFHYLATHPLSEQGGEILAFVVDLAELVVSGQSLLDCLVSGARPRSCPDGAIL